MEIIQAIYIIVGVVAVLAISAYTLCCCFAWAIELIDKWREPYWRAGTSQMYARLANAFRDEKITYIFKRLRDDNVQGFGLDVWQFRDEVEEKFKEKTT